MAASCGNSAGKHGPGAREAFTDLYSRGNGLFKGLYLSGRAAFVKKSGELIGLGHQTALEGYDLTYDSRIGYTARKKTHQ